MIEPQGGEILVCHPNERDFGPADACLSLGVSPCSGCEVAGIHDTPQPTNTSVAWCASTTMWPDRCFKCCRDMVTDIKAEDPNAIRWKEGCYQECSKL